MLRRGRRGATLRPFSELAGVSARGCSLPLQRRIADFGAERSGRGTQAAIGEHYGVELSLYAAESVTRRTAREAAAFNLEQGVPPGQAAATMITGLDGSMVPVVEFAAPGQVADPAAKADRRKRRRCAWKEIRVCTARAAGSATARYGACFGGPLEAGCMMRQNCEQYGMDGRTHIHGLGDGAPWIAEQFDAQFGLQASFLIDFYHLGEYLGAAAPGCAPGGRTATWLERQRRRLLANGHELVARELRRHVEPEGTPEEDAPVRACLRYLTNRTGHLDYRGAIEKDLPIGSGEVESAHRHLIQRRLKLPGAWWDQKNAAAMAQMRVLRANGDWDSFWQSKAA